MASARLVDLGEVAGRRLAAIEERDRLMVECFRLGVSVSRIARAALAARSTVYAVVARAEAEDEPADAEHGSLV